MTQQTSSPLLPRLLTKLAPPRFKSNRLRRERLIDFLIENKDTRLTIISAPAGYGKTTLLADYVSRSVKPCCWLTFDESDTDPTIFVENLVLAISRIYPQFGANGQLLPRLVEALHDAATGPEVCSRLLINQIYTQIEGDFEIVLDDHHMIENQLQINHLLSFFLNYLPDSCRVLLSCRSFSPLNLTSLILRGEVVGLGTAELMMTAQEVRELLVDKYHLSINEQDVADLTQQTEGWITGILLGSRKVLCHLTNADLANQEYLFSYLATKVLNHLPTALQHFLLECSILEYVQVDFCDQLLEKRITQECLRECEQHRLFLTQVEPTLSNYGSAPAATGYYRFHALFRGFLLEQLQQTNPQRYRDLHYRAAQLFRQQGDMVQMMSHFLQTQDYEAISLALLSISEDQLKAGHSKSIESWLNALPAANLKAAPDLLLLKARALSLNGEFAPAHAVLENLKAALLDGSTALTSPTSFLQAKVFLWSGKILRAETRLSAAVEALEKALEILKATLDEPDQSKLKAEIYLELGICLGINGQYRQALDVLKLACLIEEESGSKETLAHIYQCLALAHNGLNEDEIGQQHLKTSLKYWQETNNLAGVVDVLIILAGVYLNQTEYGKATATLEQALEQSQKASYLSGQAYSLTYQGNVCLDTNQFETAQNCYERASQLAEQANEKRLSAVLCAYSAAALRATGRPDEAKAVLEKGMAFIQVSETDHSLLGEMLRLEQIGLVLDQNDLDGAEQLLSELSLHFAPKEFKRVLAIKTFLYARLLFAQNKHKLALDTLVQALTYSTQAGSRPILKQEALHALPLLYFAQARMGLQQPLQAVLGKLIKSLPIPPVQALTKAQSSRVVEQTTLVTPELVQPKSVSLIKLETVPSSGHDTLHRPTRAGAESSVAVAASKSPTSGTNAGVQVRRTVIAEKAVTDSTTLSGSQPNGQPLVAYAMGSPQVLLYGTAVSDWRTAKASELLFFLLDQPGRATRKEIIIEALWSEVDDPAQADALFRSTLHRLRKAISADWIKRQGDSYILTVDYWYDVDQIEQLMKQGNRLHSLQSQTPVSDKQQALECYRTAASLAQGAPFLSSVYSNWCVERQENLSTLQVELFLKQAELELDLNQPEAALAAIEKCLSLDKCNDAAHLLRLRLYKKQNNPTLLTQSYQLYCQYLDRELGMKPSREVTSFYSSSFQQLNR